jgi:hypothetical protein
MSINLSFLSKDEKRILDDMIVNAEEALRTCSTTCSNDINVCANMRKFEYAAIFHWINTKLRAHYEEHHDHPEHRRSEELPVSFVKRLFNRYFSGD